MPAGAENVLPLDPAQRASAPEIEQVGGVLLVMITSSEDGGQTPFVIVQRKVFAPTPSPVTVEVGELGIVIVPDPLTNVHVQVPTVAVLPAKVAVATQTF